MIKKELKISSANIDKNLILESIYHLLANNQSTIITEIIKDNELTIESLLLPNYEEKLENQEFNKEETKAIIEEISKKGHL